MRFKRVHTRVVLTILVGIVVFTSMPVTLAEPENCDGLPIGQPNDVTEIKNDLSTPELVLQYLAQHRRDVALVSYSVGEDGTIDQSDPVIGLNADVPLPLASTMKIVLLAAYARQIARGMMNPDELISLADWERNYLPGTDGNAHLNSVSDLGIVTDELGFATDPNKQITLHQMVQAMIHFSDNAAADWLIERLGNREINKTIVEAGMKNQEPILSPLGTFLSWNNHDQGELTSRKLYQLKQMTEDEYATEVRRLHDLFQDQVWRFAEFQWRLQDGPSRDRRLLSLAGEAFLPRGTARDFAKVMGRVLSGTFISPRVCEIMRSHLEWPMQQPHIPELFLAFGNKGGSFEGGILTDANFYRPRSGDFANKARVSVLFMHEMSFEPFDRLTQLGPSQGMQQIFEAKLALERSFAQMVRRILIQERDEDEP